jgi:hypothetical protein
MKDYVESRISSVNARIDEMEDSGGGGGMVVLTASGNFVAPANIDALVTCIGGGGGGGAGSYIYGQNAGGGMGTGGKAGGDTKFGTFLTTYGGAAGMMIAAVVSLTKNQSIVCTIGAGGQKGNGNNGAYVTTPTPGTNSSVPYLSTGGAIGSGSTAASVNGKAPTGTYNGMVSPTNGLTTATGVDNSIGGRGGQNGTVYGNGGGGGGMTPGSVGPGVIPPNNSIPCDGSSGGSGAIIIEYIKT